MKFYKIALLISIIFTVGILMSLSAGCSEGNGPDNNVPPDTTDSPPDTTEGGRPDSTGPGSIILEGSLNIIGNGVAQGLAKLGDVLFVGDGQIVRSIEVGNPGAPSQLAQFQSSGGGYVLGLAVEGNLLFGMFDNTLGIFDISLPVSPTEVGSVELSSSGARDIAVLGNYVYIGRVGMGLSVVDIHDITDPVELETYFSYPTYSLTIGAGRLFSGAQTGFLLRRFDISDPESLAVIAQTYPHGETAFDMDYIYEHLFLAAGKTSLAGNDGIFTIHEKNSLSRVFTDTTALVCVGVSVEGNSAFVVDASTSGESNLYHYYAYNPAAAYLANQISLPDKAVTILAEGDFVYVLCSSRLLIYRHSIVS